MNYVIKLPWPAGRGKLRNPNLEPRDIGSSIIGSYAQAG
jgi:hypothetical protein